MGAEPSSLPERLVEFAAALRSKGISAGTSETVDAAAVIRVLGMADRSLLREGLSASLLRRSGQREVFDELFDLYFPAAVGRSEAAIADDALDESRLRDLLVDALAAGDAGTLSAIAKTAVENFGRTGDEVEGWSANRVLDRLQPQNLLARAMGRRGDAGGDGANLRQESQRNQLRSGIAAFRRMVEAEALRRTAEVRGRDRMATHAVHSQSDRIDFLAANTAELDELRRVVRPLARRLATRLSVRRRRRNRGRIDIRKTLRRSLSTGGVPMTPAFAKPHPARPELVLLCDVSGSVAGFSQFTMLLVQAMKGQFSKLRVFAFVNTMDEVTDLVGEDSDLQARIHAEAKVNGRHGSSDYGSAFAGFAENSMTAVTSRSTVLILGDARNNYQRANVEALREIAGRSRRTFWLNPEPANSWGLGDSLALQYSEIVEMHECRTVEQLARFVGRLLPV